VRCPILPKRILRFALLVLCCAICSGEGSNSQGSYPLIYFGKVFVASARQMTVRLVGSLALSAPSVAEDLQGRLWGRLEPACIGALDPASGRIVARVALPRKPYNHLITPQGKAYVTHSSLTKDGFTLSVVDTQRAVLLRELTGIAGLRTDLAQADGFVYLAAIGVGSGDKLQPYLYRIDTDTDELREVLHARETGFYWKLAAAGGRLYLGYLPSKDEKRSGRVEVRDAVSLKVLAAWQAPRGPLRALYADPRQVLLFCEGGGGATEILVLDPLLVGAARVRTAEGPMARVLGVDGRILVYLDYPFELGYREVSVCFYDLRAGKEVKRIRLDGFKVN
jgi:hypothetical protein